MISDVTFPLQDKMLRSMPQDITVKALAEMAKPGGSFRTMKEWLEANFGPTLCHLFFFPFHELYTAGLYREIAPQDAYKSPVNLAQAIRGALGQAAPAGYNVEFVYPVDGLNGLAQRMAKQADIRPVRITAWYMIDPRQKEVMFADGSGLRYERLISTLPLNRNVGADRA